MRNVLALLGRGAVAGVNAKNARMVGQEEAEGINLTRSNAEAVRAIEAAEREYTQRRQAGQDALARQNGESQRNLEDAQAWAARNPRPRRYTETVKGGFGARTLTEFDQDNGEHRRELGAAPAPAGYTGPSWGQGQKELEEEAQGSTWYQINKTRPDVVAEVARTRAMNPGMSEGRAAFIVSKALDRNTASTLSTQRAEAGQNRLGEGALRARILSGLAGDSATTELPDRPAPNLPVPGAGQNVPPRATAPQAPAMPPVPAGKNAKAYYEALLDLRRITQAQYDAWVQSTRP